MHESQQAEAIVREMTRLRTELDGEVGELREGARTLSNWRYYVHAYPWAAVGAAALVGYWLIPRRLHVNRPDARTLARLAKENRLVIESKPEAQSRGLGGALLMLVANTALRAGMAYAGQRLGAKFGPESQGEEVRGAPPHPFSR